VQLAGGARRWLGGAPMASLGTSSTRQPWQGSAGLPWPPWVLPRLDNYGDGGLGKRGGAAAFTAGAKRRPLSYDWGHEGEIGGGASDQSPRRDGEHSRAPASSRLRGN
jgi:hypothetical protein